MLVHEFIAIRRDEITNEVSYNLIKSNNCVKVKDDVIINNSDFLSSFKSHWGYIGNEHKGLDYHGITIILNQDLQEFIDVLNMYKNLNDIKNLTSLCLIAMKQDKDIIHFGI